MKKIIFIIFIIPVLLAAQFKSEGEKKVNILSGIYNESPSSLSINFFNPENFSMKHSMSMSYSSFGGQGIALGVYTNNMSYKISEKMNIEADISVVNSPYSTFGNDLSKSINGVYLSRAQINYKPADDFFISLQFSRLPYYNSYYSGYNNFGFYGFGSYFGY